MRYNRKQRHIFRLLKWFLFLLSSFQINGFIYIKPFQTLSLSSSNSWKSKTKENTIVQMGILNEMSSFFRKRSEDFVPLSSMDDVYGPPVIFLFGFPDDISNEEIQDMVSDGAPRTCASPTGIMVKRIDTLTMEDEKNGNDWSDYTMKDALEYVMNESNTISLSDIPSKNNVRVFSSSSCKNFIVLNNDDNDNDNDNDRCPVIYCSGLINSEMMATYNILAKEIYLESFGNTQAACAKAVPPAMEKTLKQIIMEITGDHMAALSDDEN